MNTFPGIAVSQGLAIGHVERIDHGSSGLHRIVCDPFRERALYDVAVVLAKDELRRLCQRSKGPDADILLFQIALLEDESFTNEIGDYIAAGAGGAAAVERAEQIFSDRLNNVDNDYIRERAIDVRDVCRRVVDILDGRPRRRPHLEQPTILVAEQFFPSDLFVVDSSMVLGMAAEADSPTSHAAIMARAMGIPMMVQLGAGVAGLAAGKRCILDTEQGHFVVQPTPAHLSDANRRLAACQADNAQPDPVLALPNITRDGTPFQLYCAVNLTARSNITKALQMGAQGVGLLRTESALTENAAEETQLAAYTDCLTRADGHSLMVRACNPAHIVDSEWGEEQLRTQMWDGQFYMPQLRALLRTTAPGDLRLLLSTVRCVEDWRAATAAIAACRAELEQQGVPLRDKLPLGCIIDNPSAAIMAGELLAEGACALAIDVRELTRLTCGLPKNSSKREESLDSPAVLRLVAGVVQDAEKRGALVYLCGLSEKTVAVAAPYLRLGVQDFCVETAALPALKKQLRAENLQ